MLDALLAEEKIPDEYLGQTQVWTFSLSDVWYDGMTIPKKNYFYVLVWPKKKKKHYSYGMTILPNLVNTLS